MKNQVIKSLTSDHGKEIIAYWKSRDVDTCSCDGCYNEKDGDSCIYYGVINGKFRCYTLWEVIPTFAEIIELPKLPKKEKLIKTVDSGNDFKIRLCVKDEIRATLTDELIKVVNSQDKRIKVLEALVLKFIKKEKP